MKRLERAKNILGGSGLNQTGAFAASSLGYTLGAGIELFRRQIQKMQRLIPAATRLPAVLWLKVPQKLKLQHKMP